LIRVDRADAVALVTVDRQEAMNALDVAALTELRDRLREVAEDDGVRVVILTGAGEKAFVAGADIKYMSELGVDEAKAWGALGHEAGRLLETMAKPTIAAVNGFALGGGTEIVLACDLAVIDETASLGLPEVQRGLMAAAGGVIRLSRQIPQKVALEAALTGEPIGAARAYELGLVNRVAPEGTALEVAIAVAETIARNAPLSVQHTKRVVHRSRDAGSDWDDPAWALSDEAMKVVFASRDAREGPTAFAEKRAPRWEGR
jgi:enoyl-CoA hydratase/carnithine racemase